MKVVFEQLGQSSLAITADTYTTVLPAVAHAAAEAVAGIVPRSAAAVAFSTELDDSPASAPPSRTDGCTRVISPAPKRTQGAHPER
jgi:hypothetical protein